MKYHLSEIGEREVIEGFHGKFIHSTQMTMAYWRIEAGYEIPEHHHEHEQVLNLIEGEFELILDGKPMQLNAGSVVIIPSDVSHSGKSITDCTLLDVFTPVREDLK